MPDQETSHAAAVVTLPVEIDLTNRERAYGRLYAAFASGASVVIADFTTTRFCDCSCLNALTALRTRAACRNARLLVAIRPGTLVDRLAELMAIGRQLPIYPDVSTATSRSACGSA